jgi:predicted TIM-barrel fold metal-dependent hydrolase
MIVDCHTHLHCPQRGRVADEHAATLENVDACFVLASGGSSRATANRELADYTNDKPNAYGFAVINPAEEPVSPKAVKAMTLDAGLCGLVLYCAEDGFHPTHSRALRLYEAAQELGLIVYFHNCPPYSPPAVLDYARPWLLDEVARTFGDLRIIIARSGAPFLEQTNSLLLKHANVYADLSIHPQRVWEVYNLVMTAYEMGVMDKLVFGSGFPFAEPGLCIETLLGFNKLLADTHLPQVPREKIRSVVERDTLTLLGLK